MSEGASSFLGYMAPKSCECCGSEPLADHKEDCNILRAMRAQAYPNILDNNGLPWWQNMITSQQEEIQRLRAKLEENNESNH